MDSNSKKRILEINKRQDIDDKEKNRLITQIFNEKTHKNKRMYTL